MAPLISRSGSLEMRSYGRVKIYPTGLSEIMVSDTAIFRLPGWEAQKSKLEEQEDEITAVIHRLGWDEESRRTDSERGCAPNPENLSRAARRAARAVADIALSNDFAWFVTLTLDQEKIDRYDIGEITKKLNIWLSNLVQRFGLRYVLVAEKHKDGAVHFHGLVNEVPGFEPSGTWKVPGHKKPIRPRSRRQAALWAKDENCHEVYNWFRWPYGYSTAIKLYGEYTAAVGYVCKYIRKQTDGPEARKVGGRWYYSGGELARPTVEYVPLDLEWMEENCPGAHFFPVEKIGARVGVWLGPGGRAALEGAEFTKAGL